MVTISLVQYLPNYDNWGPLKIVFTWIYLQIQYFINFILRKIDNSYSNSKIKIYIFIFT